MSERGEIKAHVLFRDGDRYLLTITGEERSLGVRCLVGVSGRLGPTIADWAHKYFKEDVERTGPFVPSYHRMGEVEVIIYEGREPDIKMREGRVGKLLTLKQIGRSLARMNPESQEVYKFLNNHESKD